MVVVVVLMVNRVKARKFGSAEESGYQSSFIIYPTVGLLRVSLMIITKRNNIAKGTKPMMT